MQRKANPGSMTVSDVFGWKSRNESEHIEFDFNDAHDLRPLTNRESEDNQ